MNNNPFEPPHDTSQDALRFAIPKLNGFALGVRDAFVLSILALLILFPVGRMYGQSFLSIIQGSIFIPLIWALCAGLIAETKYRRRVPNPLERRWIEWPKKTD
jgi:hypothetical protein